jgi:hypothetical protein
MSPARDCAIHSKNQWILIFLSERIEGDFSDLAEFAQN